MVDLKNGSTLPGTLGLSDDGFILLNEKSIVISVTEQAARMLEIDVDAIEGQAFSTLLKDKNPDWLNVLSEYENGNRTDVSIHASNGRRLLACLRRSQNSEYISLVQLCDLDGLNYRKKRALGDKYPIASGFLASNRTRPDFEVQRRLSPELHRVLSRGERAIQQGARILITGETGVGKTEVARFLHGSVSDATDPFVIINCAASMLKI